MRLRRERKNARVEMLPLMDVVFLLLVFFIYAMLMMSIYKETVITLPSSESAAVKTSDILTLTVKADGSLFLDETALSLEELITILRQKEVVAQQLLSADASQRQKELPSLQILADGSLAYQELYRVLDAVKAAGISRISLQAE